MEPVPSFFQALAALLIVLGLIYAVAWLMKKFSFGGASLAGFARPRTSKQLRLIETLWLDARYRVVLIEDRGQQRSIILGPQQATILSESTSHPETPDAPAAPPSDFLTP